jgi:hypothetical protein
MLNINVVNVVNLKYTERIHEDVLQFELIKSVISISSIRKALRIRSTEEILKFMTIRMLLEPDWARQYEYIGLSRAQGLPIDKFRSINSKKDLN